MQSGTVVASDTSRCGFAAALEGIEEEKREAAFVMGVRVVESAAPVDVRDAGERSLEPAGALIVIAFSIEVYLAWLPWTGCRRTCQQLP